MARIARDLIGLYESVSLQRSTDKGDALENVLNNNNNPVVVTVYIEPLRNPDNPENVDSRFFRGRYRGDVLRNGSFIRDQDVLLRGSGEELVVTRVLPVGDCYQLELQNQNIMDF